MSRFSLFGQPRYTPTNPPMVSHPEPTSSHRAFSTRGPPSVTSTSTRRHHHHGRHRSHHGGSAGPSSGGYHVQNDFPVFSQSGDVEILVAAGAGKEGRYLLHRLILAQCSGFFEAGTSGEWSKAQRERQQGGGGGSVGSEDGGRRSGEEKLRWRYELDWGDHSEGEVPMLVQKTPTTTLFGGDAPPGAPPVIRNKPTPSHTGFFRTMANFSALHISSSNAPPDPASDLLRDYDNLFRIFYNHPPHLDALNIATAYTQCKSLLTLADMYDALTVVGPRIDHHLLQFQTRLWKQIAKYPPSYLKLGYLARSKTIFREALVHVVGQWPRDLGNLRAGLPGAVLELIEDKVEELEDRKAKVEGRLFRLTLTTAKGERVAPGNAYSDWTAVSLFRQWLAENTTPAPPPPPSDRANPPPYTAAQNSPPLPPPPVNTGKLFRLLGTAGAAYLSHDEIKRFLKACPALEYSRENVRRFERKVEEIKGLAREVVVAGGLCRNELLWEGGAQVGYLTCTRVGEGEWPWEE